MKGESNMSFKLRCMETATMSETGRIAAMVEKSRTERAMMEGDSGQSKKRLDGAMETFADEWATMMEGDSGQSNLSLDGAMEIFADEWATMSLSDRSQSSAESDGRKHSHFAKRPKKQKRGAAEEDQGSVRSGFSGYSNPDADLQSFMEGEQAEDYDEAAGGPAVSGFRDVARSLFSLAHLYAPVFMDGEDKDEGKGDFDEYTVSDLSSLGEESRGTLGTERSLSQMYGHELTSLYARERARNGASVKKAAHVHDIDYFGIQPRTVYAVLFVVNFVVYTAIAVFEAMWPRVVLEHRIRDWPVEVFDTDIARLLLTLAFTMACTMAILTLVVTVRLAKVTHVAKSEHLPGRTIEPAGERRLDRSSKIFASCNVITSLCAVIASFRATHFPGGPAVTYDFCTEDAIYTTPPSLSNFLNESAPLSERFEACYIPDGSRAVMDTCAAVPSALLPTSNVSGGDGTQSQQQVANNETSSTAECVSIVNFEVDGSRWLPVGMAEEYPFNVGFCASRCEGFCNCASSRDRVYGATLDAMDRWSALNGVDLKEFETWGPKVYSTCSAFDSDAWRGGEGCSVSEAVRLQEHWALHVRDARLMFVVSLSCFSVMLLSLALLTRRRDRRNPVSSIDGAKTKSTGGYVAKYIATSVV